MKNKRLLGAIVGDILLSTFRTDKNINKESLITDKSKITGYTVITLGIAKYIMDNHHLYEGAKEPGRSAKRKELLAKSVLDLAEKHPDLEYPVWFQDWATNGKSTKDKDGIFPTCLSPAAIYFCNKTDLDSTLRMITEATQVFITDKETVIGTKALSTAIYSVQQYSEAQALADFLKCLYNINIPDNLDELPSKYGWNTSAIKALGPSIRVFFKVSGDSRDEAIYIINIIIDGLHTLVTPYVMTLMQAHHCFWGEDDNMDEYRLLLPKDLLEINDEFYEFMSKYNIGYIEDDDIEIEDEDLECEDYENISDEDNGSMNFSDLLKQL